MKQRKTLPFLLLFLLLQGILGAFLLRGVQAQGLDMVQVNELMHGCAQVYERLEAGMRPPMPESVYGYAVADPDDKMLYTPDSDPGLTVQRAAARRDTILDITLEERVVGKLIVFNGYEDQSDRLRKQALILLGSSTMLCVLFWLCYTRFLNRSVFEPFRRLEDFAMRVAGGNLDLPLSMDRDNVFGAFTESFDLMREQLKLAREQERRADQSKKELVAQLSHDIKTPIASIKAVAEVMEASTLQEASRQNERGSSRDSQVGASQGDTSLHKDVSNDSKAASKGKNETYEANRYDLLGREKELQRLSVIQAKADQIDALVSNLFHATLEELEELKVHPSEQDSRGLRELLRQADYLKKADVGDIPECLVWYDPMRLQQVFDNLIGNSYKYAGTPIWVTAELSQGALTIDICDSGPGVPEEELPLLYEKFYRGRNGQGKSGAGLGLFISHYLMERMDGELTCKNGKRGFLARVCLKI